MITYRKPSDAHAIYYPALPSAQENTVELPRPTNEDRVVLDLKLTAALAQGYDVWPGRQNDVHTFFDFEHMLNAEEGMYLPPTITSYYGHEVIVPYGLTITPISETRKTRLVLLTLHRADGDQTRQIEVVAWQGDNDTFHLTRALPGEHEVLGVDKAIFGKRDAQTEERRDYRLGLVEYGPSAILDVDVTQLAFGPKPMQA